MRPFMYEYCAFMNFFVGLGISQNFIKFIFPQFLTGIVVELDN